MTRFLHITDLHITAPETDDPSQQTDTCTTFDRLMEAALRLDPRPAFIIASGDLTNIGDEASYRWLAERLAGFDIPVVMTLGNHDKRGPWHAVFSGHAAAPDGPVDHDVVIGGVHVIMLDSSIPGRISGALDSTQLDRLRGMLDRHPDLPKVLAIHHPPRIDPDARYVWATMDRESTDRLGDLLSGRRITALLSGHIHINRLAIWRGVPVVVNTGMQSSVDVTRPDALAVIEGTGFGICDLVGDMLQVTFASLDAPVIIKEISTDRLRAFV